MVIKKRVMPLLASLLILISSATANNLFFVGANSSGLAHASVMRYNLWAAFHNQAGLAHLSGLSAGFYHETRYMLKELSTQSFVLAVPTSTGTFALTYANFGYTKYHERHMGIAYGKLLGSRISVGIQIDYLHTYIQEYDKKNTFTFEAGVISEPLDHFFIGAHIFNPTHTKMASYDDEKIPTIFRIGAGYDFYEKVFLAIETEKETEQKTRMKIGGEWSLFDNFFLRTGISNHPITPTFGMGYCYKKFNIDLSVCYHQILGTTPQFSLTYGL